MNRLPPRSDPNGLYVLDLSAWVYRFWVTTGRYAARHFMEVVKRIVREQEPARLAVACDMPFPTFRHALTDSIAGAVGYKANRAAQDPAEKAAILEQRRIAEELLQDYFGAAVFKKRGFEADDIIATLVRYGRERGWRVVIIGLDKDLMQLVTEDVLMWDGKRGVVGPDEVYLKFGVHPEQIADFLALVGDKSDNVPGVPGMGPKAAAATLSARGSLEKAIEEAFLPAGHSTWAKSRHASLIREHHDLVQLSKKLVTLVQDVPLKLEALA